jgi:DNA-binding transcriptional ArsR family regulator
MLTEMLAVMLAGGGALADGTRLAIVACLADGPRAVGQLAAGLPVSRSAVSQHLKILKDAGLVEDSIPTGSGRWPGTPVPRGRRLRRFLMVQAEAVTVRGQVVVDVPVERAFAVFTGRFGDFKPPEHNLLGSPVAETVFEPRVGGDRGPPVRVMFSWDISPRWTIETDQAQASEVEVRFYAESPARTRVELEHRHIDRHGPGWEAVAGGVDGPEGWPLYPGRYAALVQEAR